MTPGAKIIALKIGVPPLGTPTVYRCGVVQSDSIGEVERGLDTGEKLAVARALVAFLATLLE